MGQDNKYILKVHDGAASSNQSVVATHERVYEKKYFSFYKSHTKSDSSVDEATSNDIEVWYKHWTIKASIVFFVFAAFILSTKISSMTNDDTQEVKSSTLSKKDIEPSLNNSLDKPVPQKNKSDSQIHYENMIKKSKDFHPYYKVDLSVSGSATYTDNGSLVKVVYFSAAQNGQHIFTLKSHDLLMAGYNLQILSDCAVYITYFDYADYLTCNKPTQSVSLGGETVPSLSDNNLTN
jgi:zona occludens toxin